MSQSSRTRAQSNRVKSIVGIVSSGNGMGMKPTASRRSMIATASQLKYILHKLYRTKLSFTGMQFHNRFILGVDKRVGLT